MEPEATTDEQNDRVIKVLEDRSPRLAGVYRSVLSVLRGTPEPGCEGARVAVVCHCMRELMLNLPAALGDSIIARPNPSSGLLVAKLPSLLSSHPELDLELDQDMVPVPRKVARQLALLVKARVQEDGRNQKNFAALVTGGSDTEAASSAVQQWKDAYDFFVGWAHLDRNHERAGSLPSDEEILTKVRVVEDVIEVRTAVFFANLHSIEDLLAGINASSEEDE